MTATEKQQANLRPLNQRTSEEARRIQSNGGKASAQARRKKRYFGQVLREAVNIPIKTDGQPIDILEAISIEDLENKNLTVQDTIIVNLIKKAMTGDKDSIKLILDMTKETNESSLGDDLIDDRSEAEIEQDAREYWNYVRQVPMAQTVKKNAMYWKYIPDDLRP